MAAQPPLNFDTRACQTCGVIPIDVVDLEVWNPAVLGGHNLGEGYCLTHGEEAGLFDGTHDYALRPGVTAP